MDNSLYTEDVHRYIFSKQWPIKPEIRELVHTLQLVFYHPEVINLSMEDVIQLQKTVNDVIPTLRNKGIPINLVKIPTPRGSVDRQGNIVE